MVLSNEELNEIVGGGVAKWVIALGVALAHLGLICVGFVDGYLRPLSCNK